MAAPRYPTTQHLAGNFVLSAGSVLFRRVPVSTGTSTSTSNPTPASTPSSSSLSGSSSMSASTPRPPAPTKKNPSTTTTTPVLPTNKLNFNFEICILHQLTRNEWLLPKGRKDRGETLERAATRETYEETGYRCSLWPQRMRTLATQPGGGGGGGTVTGDPLSEHRTQLVDDLVEPIAVTIRQLPSRSDPGCGPGSGTGGGGGGGTGGGERTKMIFWYITLVDDGAVKVEGSQMDNECFESVFLGVEEAVERLTFQTDRDVVRQAVEIVLGGDHDRVEREG